MKNIKHYIIGFLVITNLGFFSYIIYQRQLKTKVENEIANCHSELTMALEKAEQAQQIAEQQAAIAQQARAEALRRLKETESN